MKARLAIVLAAAALIVAVLGWTSIGESAPQVGSAADAPAVGAELREPAAVKLAHRAKVLTKIVKRDLVIPAATGSFDDGTFRAGEKTAVAKCPSGWARTGGGASSEFGHWEADEPVEPNAWRVRFFNTFDSTASASMQVVCTKVVVQKATA